MIFVTVGTPQQPFDRLVRVADEYAAQTDETIVIQGGTTTYEPRHAEFFRWTTFQSMEKYTQESRVVITQASAGAIILASKYHKPIIVVPRLSKFKEHFNDHQFQLALALREHGQAVVVEILTVPELQNAIHRALALDAIQSSREHLVNGLKIQLDAWQKQRKSSKSG
ncbi:MAG: glycosyltransferase [Anaerolineaceae bacterium]